MGHSNSEILRGVEPSNTGANLIIVARRFPFYPDGTPTVGGMAGSVYQVGTAFGADRDRVTYIGISPENRKGEIAAAVGARPAEEQVGIVEVGVNPGENLGHYRFSSSGIWHANHGLPYLIRVSPSDWESYRGVNRLVAHAALEHSKPGDIVWVQDFHFLLVGQYMDELTPDEDMGGRATGLFIHIPVREELSKVPAAEIFVPATAAFHAIGFQTQSDRLAYMELMKAYCPAVQYFERGDGTIQQEVDGKVSLLSVNPIGVGVKEMRREAGKAFTVEKQRPLTEGTTDVLVLSRLGDPAKGIMELVEAVGYLCEHYPGERGRITVSIHGVPSRQSLPEYVEELRKIEEEIGVVNDTFGYPGWQPIRYNPEGIFGYEKVSAYCNCDMVIIPSIRDGMNLVTKEAASVGTPVVLSEGAGAAEELKGAVLVNPRNPRQVVEAILGIIGMSPEERFKLIELNRRAVEEHTIYDWGYRALSEIRLAQQVRNQRGF